jgi:large subunit ribosomal protein L18
MLVGEDLAKKAVQKEVTTVVFDRGNRPYHGRIASLAEGARKQGLIF